MNYELESLREENRQLKAQLAALKPATESPNPERSQLEALGKNPRLRWAEKQFNDQSWHICVGADGATQGEVFANTTFGGFSWLVRNQEFGTQGMPGGTATTIDEAKAACKSAILARLEGK